jgi:hypothetical protein
MREGINRALQSCIYLQDWPLKVLINTRGVLKTSICDVEGVDIFMY